MSLLCLFYSLSFYATPFLLYVAELLGAAKRVNVNIQDADG